LKKTFTVPMVGFFGALTKFVKWSCAPWRTMLMQWTLRLSWIRSMNVCAFTEYVEWSCVFCLNVRNEINLLTYFHCAYFRFECIFPVCIFAACAKETQNETVHFHQECETRLSGYTEPP
jgi:hypothetical protein